MKRRQFLSAGSRWLALGGLLGITGFLMYRRQFGDPDNCFKNPFCKSCNQFSSCTIVASLKPDRNERKKGK